MQQGKDLSWLSAPAFFLIIGMMVINTKKINARSRQPEKVRTVVSVIPAQKSL
jgi:hypothetical protein